MKKKLSVAPLFALLLGSLCAFTFKTTPLKESRTRLTSYYWFNPSSIYKGYQTVPNEQSISGCNGTTVLCEGGYLQSQLVNPANPSQGVKPGETPAVQIFRN